MRLTNDAGIDVVHLAGGETVTAVDDVFDLPDDVGRHLLEFPALGWQPADEDDDQGADEDDDTTPKPRRPRRRKSTT